LFDPRLESRGYCFPLCLASLSATLYYLSTPLASFLQAYYFRNIIRKGKIVVALINLIFMMITPIEFDEPGCGCAGMWLSVASKKLPTHVEWI
jgi:hypothetical protein